MSRRGDRLGREEIFAKRILAECLARGIVVTRRGIAFHLVGRGIDVTTTDLSLVRLDELAPPTRG